MHLCMAVTVPEVKGQRLDTPVLTEQSVSNGEKLSESVLQSKMQRLAHACGVRCPGFDKVYDFNIDEKSR